MGYRLRGNNGRVVGRFPNRSYGGECCRARDSHPSPVFTRAGSNLPPSRGKGFVGAGRAYFHSNDMSEGEDGSPHPRGQRRGRFTGAGSSRGNNGRGRVGRAVPEPPLRGRAKMDPRIREDNGGGASRGRALRGNNGRGRVGGAVPEPPLRGRAKMGPRIREDNGGGGPLAVDGALGAGDASAASGVRLQGVAERLGQGLEDSFRFVVTVLPLQNSHVEVQLGFQGEGLKEVVN